MIPAGSSDTICAIATATGGGIGVIRVSGPRVAAIAARLVRPAPQVWESHRLYHGWVHHPSTGEPLDEVLACLMRGPRSYTGEDVLEVHAHGGAANLARLLEATLGAGARLAEPGEFTRRAFLRGRIDLTRAEAVATIIAARSERALRVAQSHLRGELARAVDGMAERLVALLAEIEARVDFPEEDLDFAPAAGLAEEARALGRAVGGLAASYRRGRALVEGIDVVLAGRPNAGKSSLLNALAGEERALVDALPGTTRDFIECEVDLGGVRATVVDTAGERAEAQAVERRGLELGRRRRARADVVIVVVDATVGWGAVEAALAQEAGARALVAWNKSDLKVLAQDSGAPGAGADLEIVPTWAIGSDGVEALRRAIRRRVEADADEAALVVTSARQAESLGAAASALASGAESLAMGAPPELAAVDLRIALGALERTTGRSLEAGVLDAVFARFCIGK